MAYVPGHPPRPPEGTGDRGRLGADYHQLGYLRDSNGDLMSDSNDDMGPLGWILMIGFVGLILGAYPQRRANAKRREA